jgi:putative acetyltransferase
MNKEQQSREIVEPGVKPRCHALTPTPPPKMEIRLDDLRGSEVAGLLAEHLRSMVEVSPPASRHALNLDELRKPEITFWSVWMGNELAGCGALKELDAMHGEIKSMRTARAYLRRGVASGLLEHIISEAKRRGYRRLSLETGAMAYFEPAHQLYRKFGFERSAPFAGYRNDPNSVFMTMELDPSFSGRICTEPERSISSDLTGNMSNQ